MSRAAATKITHATTIAATVSPWWKPASISRKPASTATEPAMSPAKWNALERRAAEPYLRALRTDTVTREMSMTSAVPMTAYTYQAGSSVSPPPVSRPIASTRITMPPPVRMAASPSAARFSARRWP